MLNAKKILFAEMAAISLVSGMITVLPIGGLILSLVMLIFAGKKYFVAFSLFLFVQTIPLLMNVLPLQLQLVNVNLNREVFNSSSGAYIVNPSPTQIHYAVSHAGSISIFLLGAAASSLVGLGILLAIFFVSYFKLKKALLVRVRRFPS